MNVSFSCPTCEHPARLQLTGPVDSQCPACDHLMTLRPQEPGTALSACAVCGNTELYKKKDFPHWLGMTILLTACLGSVIPYYLYHQWLVWTILIGSALVDGLLYLWVGDVVVCYRCGAHHRGLGRASEQPPFDLGIAERYRQEKMRREQLQAARKV